MSVSVFFFFFRAKGLKNRTHQGRGDTDAGADQTEDDDYYKQVEGSLFENIIKYHYY